jgi:hypothetical protein
MEAKHRLGVLGLVALFGCGESPVTPPTPDATPQTDSVFPLSDFGPADGNISKDAGQGCANCPNACVTWHEDKDNDGYGRKGSTAEMACSKPQGGAFSWADNDADCADGDARANPDAKSFFHEGIKGDHDLPWDFNCNGIVETEFDYPAVKCPETFDRTECKSSLTEIGWHMDEQPPCGHLGEVYLTCTLSGTMHVRCRPDVTEKKTQRCR